MQVENKKKLYVWSEGWGEKYIKVRGVPHSVDVLVQDSPSGHPGTWSLYSPYCDDTPPVGEYAFPKEVFVEVPANNKIHLDFLGLTHRVKLVSETMLRFLREQGLTDGYEVAAVKNVVSRKGKVIETEKKYFALRFFAFDDKLLSFQNKVKIVEKEFFETVFDIYPNMRIKRGVDKKIFVLDHLTYSYTLVFTKEIMTLIEENNFVGPRIYAMDEYYKAFVD